MTTTAAPGAQLTVPLPPDHRVAASGLTAAEKADTIAQLVRAVGEVESAIRTATAWRTELLAAARRAVELVPEAMLAPELEPDVWRGDEAAELAQRALVADLATTLSLHERTTSRLLDEAELLVTTLPQTSAALRAGAVSYRHAQAIVEHTADLDPDDREAVETATLPTAATMPPGAFDRHVRRARERLLAEPIAARHARAASHRTVRVDPARDGMALLTAYLPAVTACAVMDRVDHAVHALRGPDEPRTADQLRADVLSALLLDDGTGDLVALSLQPQPTTGRVAPTGTPRTSAATTPGAGPDAGSGRPGGPDGTGTEHLDDALPPGMRELWDRLQRAPFEPDDSPRRVEASRAAMARIARSIVPRVTVTVPALTLLRTLATECDPPDTADPAPPPTSPPATTTLTEPAPVHASRDAAPPPADRVAPPELAHLDGYGPIDDHTATLLAAHAPSFRRLLTHPHTGAVLAMGRDTYVVPADLRAYLRLRDATCRFPGCSRAAARCDVDHTLAYVAGGTTDATNLAHLCRAHHRLKHATGWDVRQTGTDGTLVWTSTTGAEHVTRPAVTLPADDPPF